MKNKERIALLEEQLRLLRVRLGNAENQLLEYTKAVGPLWRTTRGHRRPMGMLSTPHLNTLLNGDWLDFGPIQYRQFAQEELERRAIDREHRKRERLLPRLLAWLRRKM